jgi:hypothetical protein
MRPASFAVVIVICALLAGAAASAESAPAAAGSIAVAPFERRAAPGVVLPDIDQLLADRIGTLGVAKIVGPAELPVEANAEPTADTVAAWSQ